MLPQNWRREPHQFAADDSEARLLETADDIADVPLLHAVGFEDDQRSLHKYGPARYQRLVAREARSWFKANSCN
jgi:hypothetical protein